MVLGKANHPNKMKMKIKIIEQGKIIKDAIPKIKTN
jgi:hypothetical protein